MQVVILCGGRGTRLEAEAQTQPKPMVRIGPQPLLWHLMKHYAHFGHRSFVLCLGHLGEVIRHYFLTYDLTQSDLSIELGRQPRLLHHSRHGESGWRVTLADTGLETGTGARLGRVKPYVGEDPFLLTYGDGLADVDLNRLISFHRSHGKIATVTAVRPPARFGELTLQDGQVRRFSEKPQTSEGLINGGFFVFNRTVFDYLPQEEGGGLERHTLARLAQAGELMAYEHTGFWQCVDTVRELNLLRELWERGAAPWKAW
jgi:glucose-1-phosphate cytidylyltransferase